MRVLISAYACEPGKGSEPEVGLQIVFAAASEHEVWVITRENNLPAIEGFLQDHPLRDRIHPVGFDVDGLARSFKKRGGSLTLQWYYDRWQRSMSKVATRLDQEIDFDVVHHATFASYWTRAGVAAVNKPLVWGPVGGGVKPPLLLFPVMGFRGALNDLVRISFRPLSARVSGSHRTARQASVVLAANPETASILDSWTRASILPNALVAARAIEADPEGHERTMNVITAGRLLGWKGIALAIRAMSYVKNPDACLDVFGDGYQLRTLRKLASRLGLSSRVRFKGQVARAQLLEEISRAGVLVHTSLHEEGGFVVAEALALGTPVVLLDRGGPPVISTYWHLVPSRRIAPSTTGQTAKAIAFAIDELTGQEAAVNPAPAEMFRNDLLRAYSQAVAEHAL